MELNIRSWESLVNWRCIRPPSFKNLKSSFEFFKDNYFVLVMMSAFYNYVIYEFFDVMLLNVALNVAATIFLVFSHASLYNRYKLPENLRDGNINDRDNLISDNTLTEFQNRQTNQSYQAENRRNIESFRSYPRRPVFPNHNFSELSSCNVKDHKINDQDHLNRSVNTFKDFRDHQTNHQAQNRKKVENVASTNAKSQKYRTKNHNYSEFRNSSYKNNNYHRNFRHNFENCYANSQTNARKSKFYKRKSNSQYPKKEQGYDSNLGFIIFVLLICGIAYQIYGEAAIPSIPEEVMFNFTNSSSAHSKFLEYHQAGAANNFANKTF